MGSWSAGRVDVDVDRRTASGAGDDPRLPDRSSSVQSVPTDARYGWASACEEAFGQFPVPICHECNTIAHLNEYEGSPEARPLSREELQRFLDYADEQVERAARAKRKGALAAYRDATLFKVIYGWGLRRTETAKLDLADWGPPGSGGVRPVRDAARALRQGGARPTAPSAQRRFGDGLGGGGGRRLRRHVGPRFGAVDHPALWITERGGRVKPAEINARFVAYRDALGLPRDLSPHSPRHSYVTHLTEDGADRRFIQEQVGHRCDTSTATTPTLGNCIRCMIRIGLSESWPVEQVLDQVGEGMRRVGLIV